MNCPHTRSGDCSGLSHTWLPWLCKAEASETLPSPEPVHNTDDPASCEPLEDKRLELATQNLPLYIMQM